jgi:hypothetical protein
MELRHHLPVVDYRSRDEHRKERHNKAAGRTPGCGWCVDQERDLLKGDERI